MRLGQLPLMHIHYNLDDKKLGVSQPGNTSNPGTALKLSQRSYNPGPLYSGQNLFSRPVQVVATHLYFCLIHLNNAG